MANQVKPNYKQIAQDYHLVVQTLQRIVDILELRVLPTINNVTRNVSLAFLLIGMLSVILAMPALVPLITRYSQTVLSLYNQSTPGEKFFWVFFFPLTAILNYIFHKLMMRK